MTALDTFNALLRADSDLRRVFLLAVAERRAVEVARAFQSAKSLDDLAHARGVVAVLDELATAFEKGQTDAVRRQEYTDRSSRSAAG